MKMSHNCLLEKVKQDLRHVEREIKRQMELLGQYLQQLHKLLPVPSPCSPALCFCCSRQRDPRPWERGSLTARLDMEQELSRMRRSLNGMSNSSHDHKFLALMDVKDFDSKEVTVTVRDGKVKVLAEHKEERTTARAKEYNYRSITKEISLPPGVREDEVTYSLGPNGTVKIAAAHKRCPYLLSC
ncbi:outer dense fiber protein 1 [Falco biarmicus]|uniref:outer dense fiber protein 1 n=1 Tax=Falco biarmicus TaxID=345155 RepID=UPI0024BCD4C8|nr:outer dense fiber protein 1 [Falco biarmicus]